MSKVTLVFDGGSRNNRRAGFGSYAVIKEDQRTITRLEFGGQMTNHEAEYDTLITALEMLIRQEVPGEVVLEIQSASQLVIKQVEGTWRARNARLQARRDRVCRLLSRFKTSKLTHVSREQVMRALNH